MTTNTTRPLSHAVAALTQRLAGQLPARSLLARYRPPQTWFARPDHIGGIHGIGHEARVLIWQELLARLVLADGQRQALDQEALRWAAVIHDTQRVEDGLDLLHGSRAATWVRRKRTVQKALTAPTLETLAYLCTWHVPPDSAAPTMTAELAVFKDADGLDRVRLGDLNARYLRWEASRDLLLPLASPLFRGSLAREWAGGDPFESALDAGVDLGLLGND